MGLLPGAMTALVVIGATTAVLASLVMTTRVSVKVALAWSTAAQMGFMLLGLTAGVVGGNTLSAGNAYSSAMFYVFSYVLMTLAAFGVLLVLSRAGFDAETLEDLKGLNKRSSWFAGMMAIVMFSMAGIPFFIGFYAKFSVLLAVVASGYKWLAVFAVMMSLIGAFYYLKLIRVMFFEKPESDISQINPDRGPWVLLDQGEQLLDI